MLSLRLSNPTLNTSNITITILAQTAAAAQRVAVLAVICSVGTSE
jgi:hypothetical protein